MHPFETLAQPIRRRIIEILASGEHLSGDVEAVITHEFGVSRSAVQHHLAALRRDDWVIVREEETMRGYRLNPAALDRLEREVKHIRRRWKQRIGWIEGTAPFMPHLSSRGYRGHGADPDDPWSPKRRAGLSPSG